MGISYGALIACKGFHAPFKRSAAETISATGVLMIFFAAVTYDKQTEFPGLHAFLPCMGAAMVILANGNTETFVRKILSSKSLVYIGLRSYALYLWHWPVIVFAAYLSPDPLTGLEKTGLMAFSFILAMASYRFVESPVRHRRMVGNDRVFISIVLASSAILLAIGATTLVGKGFPARFDMGEYKVQKVNLIEAACIDVKATDFLEKKCLFGKPRARESFVIWGDSHAYAMTPAIDRAARKVGKAGTLSSTSGCPPLPSVKISDECNAINALILSQVKPGTYVFLVARWNYYFRESLLNGEGASLSGEEAKDLTTLEKGIADVTRQIRSKGGIPVFVGPHVEFYKDVPESLLLHGRDVTVPRAMADRNNIEMNAFAAELRGAYLVDPVPLLCDKNICKGSIDKKPLYLDNDHLNKDGAYRLIPLFEKAFKQAR